MKLVLTAFETKSPSWVVNARDEYVSKVSHFVPFEWKAFKSPSADRDDAKIKQKKEAEILFKFLDPSDFLIIFDESGEPFSDSKAFAEQLRRVVESGKSRAVLSIGGAYGFGDDVKKRAQMKWSLSRLTMNHWVAQIAALEQIYRGFTILKGLPYHN